MPNFNYQAINAKGKITKGKMEALDASEVVAYLKSERLTPIEVIAGSKMDADIEISFLQKKPSPRDMAIFCRQFVSITRAGVAISNTLEMLSEQTENKMLQKAIEACRQGIQSGSSLSEAMSIHDHLFPEYFITMVAAGEASGNLDISFERMGEQFEKDAKIKAAIKKATIYPIVILCVAVVVMAGMLGFVVPQFETMLSDMGSEMPWLTQMIINMSDFLVARWYIVIAVAVFGVFAIVKFLGTTVGSRFKDKVQLKIALISQLVVKSTSARFCRTLATLLGSGVPITESLTITENVVDNVFFKEAVAAARGEVSLGTPLSQPIHDSGLFPPMVHHMVKIGEEVGDLEMMLDKTAEYYEDEVENAVQSLMAALEPLIIVVLALTVGVVVLALIMPMGTMIGDLGNL